MDPKALAGLISKRAILTPAEFRAAFWLLQVFSEDGVAQTFICAGLRDDADGGAAGPSFRDRFLALLAADCGQDAQVLPQLREGLGILADRMNLGGGGSGLVGEIGRRLGQYCASPAGVLGPILKHAQGAGASTARFAVDLASGCGILPVALRATSPGLVVYGTDKDFFDEEAHGGAPAAFFQTCAALGIFAVGGPGAEPSGGGGISESAEVVAVDTSRRRRAALSVRAALVNVMENSMVSAEQAAKVEKVGHAPGADFKNGPNPDKSVTARTLAAHMLPPTHEKRGMYTEIEHLRGMCQLVTVVDLAAQVRAIARIRSSLAVVLLCDSEWSWRCFVLMARPHNAEVVFV